MSELLPCPKCGPHNLIRELSINDRVWVKCTSCTFTAWEEDWNARADGWISVDDRLPDDEDIVIGYTNYDDCYVVYYSSLGEWREANGYSHDYWHLMKFTHWRPLPPPPETLK